MIKIGILSDTHIPACTQTFRRQVQIAFADCDIVVHAGDLTDYSILAAFEGKTVHAVHGNTCNVATQQALPHTKIIRVAGFSIGISHGAGPLATIEDRLWGLFPEADCIIFGHTHVPLCTWHGSVLFINPGSFRFSSSSGAPATYAILTLEKSGMKAKLHTLSGRDENLLDTLAP